MATLDELKRLAISKGTQFNYLLPDGSVLPAGSNPGQAATLDLSKGVVGAGNEDLSNGFAEVRDYALSLGASSQRGGGGTTLDRGTTRGAEIANSLVGQNVVDPMKSWNQAVASAGLPVNTPPPGDASKPLTPDQMKAPQSLPSASLQPGATGDAVKQLQDYLVSQGLMTQAQVNTGYGTYGPQTTAAVKALQEKLGVDNSSGVGYFGPRTITALQGGMSNMSASTSTSGYSTPSTISNPITPPTGGSSPAPVLPQPQAFNTSDTYIQSLTAQIEKQKADIQTEADKRAKEYETKIKNFETEMADLQTLQDEGMDKNLEVVTEETTAKKAALELEKQRFDENYNANQALIGELDGLLTTGNQVIEQMRNTTGLASIMNPRIAKTMSDVEARAGVIQAVLSARNGQMTYAQQQLGTTVDALSSIATDQINYYNTLVNFYQNRKEETKDSISNLTKEQKDFLDVKLNMLTNDLERLQQTADIVSKAMVDPDTALNFASAGVTLNDSPEVINKKLANYAYSKELADTSNTMATNGYTSTPIVGVSPTTVTDSRGGVKQWYKRVDSWSAPYLLGGDYVQKNTLTGEIRTAVNVPVGDNSSGVISTTVQTYSSTLASALADGATVGEAVLAAQAIAKQTGQNISSAEQTALLEEAKRLEAVKNAPVSTPTGSSSEPNFPSKLNVTAANLSPENIKAFQDAQAGISNFFK